MFYIILLVIIFFLARKISKKTGIFTITIMWYMVYSLFLLRIFLSPFRSEVDDTEFIALMIAPFAVHLFVWLWIKLSIWCLIKLPAKLFNSSKQ